MEKEAKDYVKRGRYSAGALLVGITLIIVMLGLSADYDGFRMLIYIVLGIVLCVIGVRGIKNYLKEKQEHDMDFSDDFKDASERSDDELVVFRNHFSQFFSEKGIQENSVVQNDTTQIYKNVLDLQKKRIDKLGIQMEFRSVRKKYSGAPVRSKNYFDGKYAISDIDEQIEAKRKFTRNGNRLFVRTSNQVAHYTVLDAKRADDSENIICPNCGNVTTRENLIDGCDYCGTKFKVEDLGRKVSSFSFRDNYDIAYAKFKSLRSSYLYDACIVIFAIVYFFVLFCITVLLFDDPGEGDAMNPLFWVFSILGVGGCFAALLSVPAVAFYTAVIFPALNISASFKYCSKSKLEALKAKEKADKDFVYRVRSFDKNFSAADFNSNIQNKISTVLFADNKVQVNAFADCELEKCLSKYQKVFDYDIDSIDYEKFKVENGLQTIDLAVNLRLFQLEGGKAVNRREKVKMKLVKSAESKTASITTPSVMKCKGCGSSLSLTNGLVCDYCGAKLDLKQHDWVIREFN